MLLRDFRLVCPRCYRLPRGEPPFEWCALCISKLAIVFEYDQQEASEHHSLSVFDWKAVGYLGEGTLWVQEEMP